MNLFFAFILSFSAQANEETRVADLIRAPSLSNLKLKIKETDHLENIRTQCEIQLKYGMLPARCFEVIRIEKRDGLLSDEKFKKTEAWLIENCEERAAQPGETNRDQNQLRLLPKACREIAERKLNDQHYRDITMNPSSLFKRRM